MMQLPCFPFTAIVGQSNFKLALILATLNPSVGGVLISGPRGCAKSTLARSLVDVAQTNDSEPYSFVTLPLGATEEMLVGTLNLQDVLKNKTVAFQQGLLAKADGGTLYVDEVNLLPDNLVDLLLDVAASGNNVIERDGISHQHRAKFLLLGTMNPDEGELRPQLQDRFGFSVNLTNACSIEDRVNIVRLREAFDSDPKAFIEKYKPQQQALNQRIVRAKQGLTLVECSDEYRTMIAEKCHEANVEGLRADIVWYRAAVAHAAWRMSDLDNSSKPNCNEQAVSMVDVLAVEELVLSHRRKTSANTPSTNSPPDSSSFSAEPPFSRPPSRGQNKKENIEENIEDLENKNLNKSRERSNNVPKHDGEAGKSKKNSEGDWGQMEPQLQSTGSNNLALARHLTRRSMENGRHDVKGLGASREKCHSARKGYNNVKPSTKGTRGRASSTSIDWFASLVANIGQWPLQALRYRKTKVAQPIVHLILLDTSASTLEGQLLRHAKAAIVSIAEQAYLKREQLTIVGFGNNKIETLLPQRKAPKILLEWLDTVCAAGGTPLKEVLDEALRMQKRHYRQQSNSMMKTYLVTDGRTTQSFTDKHLLGDVMVIDTEQSSVKRGKAKEIAQVLNADYFALPI